jgi:hypothetical protein
VTESTFTRDVFFCHCGHNEHQIVLSHYKEPGDPFESFYLSVSLYDNLSLPRRVLYAIKYIFGYRSRYGAFAEIVLSPSEAKSLSDSILSNLNVPN